MQSKLDGTEPQKKKPAISTESQIRIAKRLIKSAKLCFQEQAFSDAKHLIFQALEYCPVTQNNPDEIQVNFDVQTMILVCDYKIALANNEGLEALLPQIALRAATFFKEVLPLSLENIHTTRNTSLELLTEQKADNSLLLHRVQIEIEEHLFGRNFDTHLELASKYAHDGSYADASNTLLTFLSEYQIRLTSIQTSLKPEHKDRLVTLINQIFIAILANRNLPLSGFIQAYENHTVCSQAFTKLSARFGYQEVIEYSPQYNSELIIRIQLWLAQLTLDERFDEITKLLAFFEADKIIPQDIKHIIISNLLVAIQNALIKTFEESCLNYTAANFSNFKKQMTHFMDQVKKLIELEADNRQQLQLVIIHTLRQCAELASSSFEHLANSPGNVTTLRVASDSLYFISSQLKNEAKSLLPKRDEKTSALEVMKASPEHNIELSTAIASAYLMLLQSAENPDSYNHCIKEALFALTNASQLVELIADEQIRINKTNEINALKEKSLNNNSPAAMNYKINTSIVTCEHAKKDKNLPLLITSCLELIMLKKEAELLYPSSGLPKIASFSMLHNELAIAYAETGDMRHAREQYLMSLSYDPNNIRALQALQSLQKSEQTRAPQHDPQRILFDALEKKSATYFNKTQLSQKFPPHVIGLFDAVLQGDGGAYDMLKVVFTGALNNFALFAQYILLHDDEVLKNCQINALYDIALNIQIGNITIEGTEKKSDLFVKLYTMAANRHFGLALYKLGRLEDSKYEFEVAKSYYKRAAELGSKEGTHYLAMYYKRKGEYSTARRILNNLFKDKTLNEAQRSDIKNQLAHIHFLENLASDIPQTPINITKNSAKCVIYIDFDNTLMKSQDHAGTFYKLYKNGECPAAVRNKLEQFYTGSLKDWKEIFDYLKGLGITIGICTARYEAPGKECILFKQFLNDFGKYLDRDHIIFTNGNDKYKPLVHSCQNHGILRKHALLVDDTLEQVNTATAHGIKAIHASNLVTDPHSFKAFKQHLFKITAEIVDSCKQNKQTQNSEEGECSANEEGEPKTPVYSATQANRAPLAAPSAAANAFTMYGQSRPSVDGESASKKSRSVSPKPGSLHDDN